jgi:hypothetical protein
MRWVEVHGITIAAGLIALASLLILGMVFYKYSRFNQETHQYWERAIKKTINRIDKLALKKGYKLKPADNALIVWAGGHCTVKNFGKEQLEKYYMQLQDVLHLIEKH